MPSSLLLGVSAYYRVRQGCCGIISCCCRASHWLLILMLAAVFECVHMTLSGSSHSRPEQKWYAPRCTRVFVDTHSSVITGTLLPLDIHSAVTKSFLCCSCSSKRHRAQLLMVSPQQTITEPKGRWSSHKYAMPCRLQEIALPLHVPSSCAVLAVLQHVLWPNTCWSSSCYCTTCDKHHGVQLLQFGWSRVVRMHQTCMSGKGTDLS